MTLETDFRRLGLTLEQPFRIARSTTERTENVVLTVTDEEGNRGIGAAAPSRYYGERAGTVEAVLPELCEFVTDRPRVTDLALLEQECRELVPRNPAARAAVSIALHDLVAKRLEVPLCSYLGLPDTVPIESSYTIGIDDPQTMADRARDAVQRGHGTLKLKLGTERDAEVLEQVRTAAPSARIRVDANGAWTPREAISRIEECAAHGVEFVEQPVPAEDSEGLAAVYDRSSLPIAADESCITLSDVPAVADRCDIVNIKLMKCGGVREAIGIVHAARAHQLEVMLGCMIESAVSIAAAAHLCPLVDYADLDGALLLADDPHTGSPVQPGEITLGATPGLGVD